ncbi:MAG: class I SAM-dependent RNA methyltransferase [Anaerolineales bacterium]|jgi:23S rRNA (uracil1939-C5)-methyltransferase
MEQIELSLTGLAYGGEALGRDSSGRMIFVPFALPGERALVEVVETHKRWARARLLEVLERSPDRIDPRCAHFTLCGGCHYQHMPYAAQLRAKRDIVKDQMARIGGFEDPPVAPTVPSPSPWQYRNHMRFSLTSQGKLGFVTAASDRVFAVEECHLPEPPLADLWPRIELESIPGLTHIGVRAGAKDEQLIILHGEGNPEVEVHIELPASVVWLGPGGAAVLGGEGFLEIEVLERTFRVSAGSFFQVNTELTGELVRRALEVLEVQAGEVVFDLYAGVGLFSAALAERGVKVVAAEESPWACADFEVNLDEFDDVALYEAPVEQALPAIKQKPAAVLVDPPRGGLSRETLDLLLEAGPARLVYVSCDPATLARDGKRLAAAGYRLKSLAPIDLFPQTFHIESISRWQR